MSASQSTPGHEHRTPERSIAARTQLRNVLKALQHVLRATPLYGPASPAVERALDSLQQSFRVVWKSDRCLTLQFRDDGIWLDTGDTSLAVSAESGRDESPLKEFRDAGFNTLTFMRGFEHDELARFMELATRTFPSDCLEDLPTELWFEDFACVEFTTKDALVGVDPAALLSPVGEAHRQEDVGAPDDPPAIPEALLTCHLSADQLQLTDQETNHLQVLIAEEARRPACGDVLSALLDSLQAGDERLRLDIVARLDGLLPVLLQRGSLYETGSLLEALRNMADSHAELGPGFCTALQRTLGLFERSTVVATYLNSLESGEIVPDLEALSVFIRSLGHANAKTLVRVAERSRSKPITTILHDACEAAVERHPDLLLDLLRSDDDVVLRGSLRLVTSSRSDEAVREVIRLLRHRDARMRLVAAKSLLNVGRPEALNALMSSLEDVDEDVRQVSAWAISTWEYRPATDAILRIIKGPRLQEMVLTEKLTYFDAYARLAGKGAVAYLTELLHARHLLRPRYETDLRACAARGLGQIPGPEARQALQKAAEDRDPKVRRTVMRQLREAKS